MTNMGSKGRPEVRAKQRLPQAAGLPDTHAKPGWRQSKQRERTHHTHMHARTRLWSGAGAHMADGFF